LRLANRASSWAARRFGLVCSASALRRRVERALKELRTDYVDVLNLHAVTPAQYRLAVARILPELLRLKEEGKVRAIGITEAFLSDPDHEMLEAASDEGHFDVIMAGFNVLNPSASTRVLPRAKQNGTGTIGIFALRGLLASSPSDAGRTAAILEGAGVSSLSELAFRYARHQDGMDVVLTGTGNIEHLRQNIASAHAPPLPASVLEALRVPAQSRGASTRK
jgi:L-galactose dehydrogenase